MLAQSVLNSFIEEAVLNSKALASTKTDGKESKTDTYNYVRKEIELVTVPPLQSCPDTIVTLDNTILIESPPPCSQPDPSCSSSCAGARRWTEPCKPHGEFCRTKKQGCLQALSSR